MNSPLKWAGSKRWHVEPLKAWLGPYRSYELHAGTCRLVEPFCGGASIAFGLAAKRTALNDANPQLINFLRCLQAGAPFEVDVLAPGSYWLMRSSFNLLVSSGQWKLQYLRAAEYFYALNHWGFSGLWRVNRKGEHNVPPRKTLRPLPELHVATYAKAMSDWDLTCGDFERVILEPTDIVYADPPYDEGFTAYGADRFAWADQVRLAVHLSTHPGPVVLMNKATRRVLRLYESLGYRVDLIDAPQRMHRTGQPVLEVMATLDGHDRMNS